MQHVEHEGTSSESSIFPAAEAPLESPIQLPELRTKFTELLRQLFASASDYELSASQLSTELILARSAAIEAIQQALKLLQVRSEADESWCVSHTTMYGTTVNQLAAVVIQTTAPFSDDLLPKYHRFLDEQKAALQIREYIQFLTDNFDGLTALVQRMNSFQTLTPEMQSQVLNELHDLIQYGILGHLREAVIYQPLNHTAEQRAAAPAFAQASITNFAQLVEPYVTEQLKNYAIGELPDLSLDTQPSISTYALAAFCKLLRDNGAVITFQDVASGIVVIDYSALPPALTALLAGLPSLRTHNIFQPEEKMQLILTDTAKKELTTLMYRLLTTLGR